MPGFAITHPLLLNLTSLPVVMCSHKGTRTESNPNCIALCPRREGSHRLRKSAISFSLEGELGAQLDSSCLRGATSPSEVARGIRQVGIPSLKVDAVEGVVHVDTELQIRRFLEEERQFRVLRQCQARFGEARSAEGI